MSDWWDSDPTPGTAVADSNWWADDPALGVKKKAKKKKESVVSSPQIDEPIQTAAPLQTHTPLENMNYLREKELATGVPRDFQDINALRERYKSSLGTPEEDASLIDLQIAERHNAVGSERIASERAKMQEARMTPEQYRIAETYQYEQEKLGPDARIMNLPFMRGIVSGAESAASVPAEIALRATGNSEKANQLARSRQETAKFNSYADQQQGRALGYVRQLSEMTAKYLPAGALKIVLPTIGAETLATKQHEGLQSGMSQGEALGYGLMHATKDVLLTMAGGKAANYLGGRTFEQALGMKGGAALGKASDQTFREVAKKLSVGASSELFVEELPQYASELLIDKFTRSDYKPKSWREIGDDVADIVLLTTLSQIASSPLETASPADQKKIKAAKEFIDNPSRRTAVEAGVDGVADTKAARDELAGKAKKVVADALTAKSFRSQLDEVAASGAITAEQSQYLYDLTEARAKAAGEGMDEYVGKRIKGVETAKWGDFKDKRAKAQAEYYRSLGYEDAPNIRVRTRLNKAIRTLVGGNMDGDAVGKFVNTVVDLTDVANKQSAEKQNNRANRDLTRGYDYVMERLHQGRRRGELGHVEVEFAKWLLDQNPTIAKDLSFGVRKPPKSVVPGAKGVYGPDAMRAIIYKDGSASNALDMLATEAGKKAPVGTVGSEDTTIAHEFLHHSERLLPAEVQRDIRKEWARRVSDELAKAAKSNNKERYDALAAILQTGVGKSGNSELIGKHFDGKALTQDDYQLLNPSEFWAVNASNLAARRFVNKSGITYRLDTWLREFAQKIRSAFGLRSDAPVLQGIDAVLKSDGAEHSKMIRDAHSILAQEEVPNGWGSMPSKPDAPLMRRAEIEFLQNDGRAVIRAFESANFVSMVHELGHLFRRDLAGPDMDIAATWAGAKNGKWSRNAEEKFARGFEQYMLTGKAPTKRLAKAFGKIAEWMKGVYQTISRNPNVNLSPEMKGVYDRLFAGQEQDVATATDQNYKPFDPVAADAKVKAYMEANGGQAIESFTLDRISPGDVVGGRVAVGEYKTREKAVSQIKKMEPMGATVSQQAGPDYVNYKSSTGNTYSATIQGDGSWMLFEGPHQQAESAASPTKSATPVSDVIKSFQQPPDSLGDTVSDRFRGLANHSAIPEVRAENFVADESLGMPERRKWADANAEAIARMKADPDGELQKMLAKIEAARQSGGTLDLSDMTDMALAAKLKEAAAQRVVDDPESRQIHRTINEAFRNARTQYARVLNMRDPLASPEQRARNAVTDAMMRPTESEQNALDKAKTPADKAKVEAGIDERIRKAIEELQAEGIDVNDIDGLLRDKLKSIRVLDKFRHSTSKSDMLYEYWRNAILSGPRTHAANVIGNAAFAGYHLAVERPIESAINLFAKNPNAAQPGEFKYLIAGIAPGLKRGIKNAAQSWKLETSALADELGRDGAFKVEGARGAIPGKLGRFIRSFGYRPLLAADELFKSVSATMEAGAHAYRAAKALKLEGDALSNFVAEQVNDLNSGVWDIALTKAEELAFQRSQGIVASTLQSSGKYLRRFPGARWILPFVDTPSAILEEGLKRTPVLGAMLDYVEWRRGGYGLADVNVSATLARQAIAAVGAMLLWDAVDDNDPWITGSSPTGGAKAGDARSLSYATNPPMSVKLFGRWFAYDRLEPFATALGYTVDVVESMRNKGAGDAFRSATDAPIRQIQHKSYLEGLQQLIDLKEHVDQFGFAAGAAESGAKFLSSFMPNLYRQLASATDPNIPESRVWGSEGERLKRALKRSVQQARIPGVERLPKYDPWGRTLTYNDSFDNSFADLAWALFSPVKTKKVENVREVDAMLLRWNANNPGEERYWTQPLKSVKDPRTKKNRSLTDAQYAEYAQLSGELASKSVAGLRINVAKPTKRMVDAVANRMTAARRLARYRLMPKWKAEWDATTPASTAEAATNPTPVAPETN